ncbi:MAG: two-component system, NtrC family, response regulator AtoC [Acidobacteriota bacterium]|jgi:two-component system response regulator HydG|nr:two-component system, NtrC family, response regulator AtoC [Acidobacteriota bacterium]
MKALVVDDNDVIRSNVAEVLRDDGWEVSEAVSAEQAFEMLHQGGWALVFCDVRLSDKNNEEGYAVLHRFTQEQPEAQIVLMTGHGSAVGALDAVSSGAYDYLMKPFDVEDVRRISQAVRRGIEKRARPGTTGELPSPPVYTSDINLVGVSVAFVEVMKLVGRVAATNLPVLITGESGTGKEIVACAIHRRSPRAAKPFVAVNCGAIPSELIESELFGHVRGSFTGATVDRRGLWQEADGGTVFLDEITETSLAFQVKLLRALQEGEIRRVGSNHTQRVDVRVIAATNRDADLEMREGRFRQDLLYRLNAVTLHLPPLRERREDLLPLAKHFAERMMPQDGKPISFSRDAIRLLENYDWPGNIRELENAVVRAAALCDQVIRPEDLPERVRNFSQPGLDTDRATGAQPHKAEQPDEELLSLAEVEGRHIFRVLARTGGNKQAAARVLGIDRTTLQRKIERYSLDQNGSESAASKERQS